MRKPNSAGNGSGEDPFWFTVKKEGAGVYFRLETGSKIKDVSDFRRHTGLLRDVLREYSFIRERQEMEIGFSLGGEGEVFEGIRDPGDRFIAIALSAGTLRDGTGKKLLPAESSCRWILRIRDVGGAGTAPAGTAKGQINAELLLQDEDGSPIEKTRGAYPLSPGYALSGRDIYRTADIGPRWDRIPDTVLSLKTEDLPVYLSLMLSSSPSLGILWDGWSVRRGRPVEARAAILFLEIDRYGYLHLRPISYIEGFPPLMLENEEIITGVSISGEDRSITISEIIFPQSPEEQFSAFLRKGGFKSERQDSVYVEDGRFIFAPEFGKRFLSASIIELSRDFVLLETRLLIQYQLRFVKPRIKFSLGKGIDYLAGDATVEINGETFSFHRFIQEYRSLSCIPLADGSRAFPDQKTMSRLDRIISRMNGKNEVELSVFDIPLLLRDECIEVEGEAWEKARPFFNSYNTIGERQGSWMIEETSLRPYQEYGVRWLDYLREYGMGACLADEMGLGKTVQVIALLRGLMKNGAAGTTLIICPKTLVFNWQSEFHRFAPEIPCFVHYGSGRNLESLGSGSESGAGFEVILSTYATIRQDAEHFKAMGFFYIILDESQNIKNLATKTTAAVLSLRSRHRLALSGTPVENNLTDLYSLFRFLNPSFFGSSAAFTRDFLKPIQEYHDEEALKDLKIRLYPFMLRRLKKDVLRDLPEKTEETAFIELEEEHQKLYHHRRLEYKHILSGIIDKGDMAKSQMIILKAFTELRRLASVPEAEGEYGGISAKRLYLRDAVEELAENGHKCLIFSNFLAGVDMVSRDLAERGIGNITMTGATSDRQALVRRFQTDPDIKAFIMTLKTGGTGLNLTAADYIFILDPWWNRAAESQALDRAHRIGQYNPVFCYRMIAKDTIEERILELQKRKSDLAGALLSDDPAAFKSLSAEDIAYLVGDPL